MIVENSFMTLLIIGIINIIMTAITVIITSRIKAKSEIKINEIQNNEKLINNILKQSENKSMLIFNKQIQIYEIIWENLNKTRNMFEPLTRRINSLTPHDLINSEIVGFSSEDDFNSLQNELSKIWTYIEYNEIYLDLDIVSDFKIYADFNLDLFRQYLICKKTNTTEWWYKNRVLKNYLSQITNIKNIDDFYYTLRHVLNLQESKIYYSISGFIEGKNNIDKSLEDIETIRASFNKDVK